MLRADVLHRLTFLRCGTELVKLVWSTGACTPSDGVVTDSGWIAGRNFTCPMHCFGS